MFHIDKSNTDFQFLQISTLSFVGDSFAWDVGILSKIQRKNSIFLPNPDTINQTEKRKKLIKSVSEVTGETQFTAEIMKVFADSRRLQ